MGRQRNISIAASVAANVAATKAENQAKPLRIQGHIKRLPFDFNDKSREAEACLSYIDKCRFGCLQNDLTDSGSTEQSTNAVCNEVQKRPFLGDEANIRRTLATESTDLRNGEGTCRLSRGAFGGWGTHYGSKVASITHISLINSAIGSA